MQGTMNARLRRGPAHLPVEEGTADGRTRISCAAVQCMAWDPRPCESRHEAQFWYNRHISQPLIQHLR